MWWLNEKKNWAEKCPFVETNNWIALPVLRSIKYFFCSEFSVIPEKRRRKAMTKIFAFQANAINHYTLEDWQETFMEPNFLNLEFISNMHIDIIDIWCHLLNIYKLCTLLFSVFWTNNLLLLIKVMKSRILILNTNFLLS